MVRATRSTQLVADDSDSAPNNASHVNTAVSPLRAKSNKKRKRVSEVAEPPKEKRKKTRGKVIKQEEEEEEVEEHEQAQDREPDDIVKSPSPPPAPVVDAVKEETPANLPRREELHLSAQDAADLLLVLESLDSPQLLDHTLPLDPSSSTSTTLTLRTVLQNPTLLPIRFIHSSLTSLLPQLPTKRATPSPAVQEQLRFCQLAQGLLDEIARKSAVSLGRSSIDADEEHTSSKPQQYALYQHLPNGEYFTSAATLTAEQLSSLNKGQASLVAVLPSVPIPPANLPTLGSYTPKRNVPRRRVTSTTLSSATFLDYGPFASFAPSFDSEGGSLGRNEVGWIRGRKGRVSQMPIIDIPAEDEEMQDVMDIDPQLLEGSSDFEVPEDLLEAEEMTLLKENLADWELQDAVSKLLEKNRIALQKLVALQEERFRSGKDGQEVEVEEGGEEWKLAHSIKDTLSTLAALRPRSIDNPDVAPLIPSVSVLHALHRTLPIDPTPGWKGTLTITKDAALCDNTTVRVPLASASTSLPPVATAAPAHNTRSHGTSRPPPNAAPPAAAATSSSYPYPPHPAYQGRPPGTPGHPTTPYYPAFPQTPYHPGQHPPHSSAPQPSPYPYPYPPHTYSHPPGTPGQPQQPHQPGYSTPQPPRAIPNLAKAGAGGAPGWSGNAIPSPALPQHLRRTMATGTPQQQAVVAAAASAMIQQHQQYHQHQQQQLLAKAPPAGVTPQAQAQASGAGTGRHY